MALLALAPAFIAGTASAAGLAISLGGILMASRAFASISSGVTSLSQACVAWSLVSICSGRRRACRTGGAAPPPAQTRTDNARHKVLDISDLVFQYRHGGRPILDRLDLTIYQGERILVEGPSGGGKSRWLR